MRQLLFVYCEHRRDLRVEARAKSERFAHEMPKDRNCSAQTEQPGGCSPGRAAKGENPVASTKNRRSAFAGLRFFAVQPSLNERTFGSKPNARSRKGSRKNRAASFVGKGGTSRPVKPRGTQRRTLRLSSDAGTKRSWVLPSPQPYKKELTCVSSFLFSCNVRGGGGRLSSASRAGFPVRLTGRVWP